MSYGRWNFPKNSLINDLAKQGKEIESITTADLTDGGEVVWHITDVTKEPNEWYGNTYNEDKGFDSDNQGVFTINSNKAYWVKLKNKDKMTTTLSADSKLVQESVPHFDNSVKSTNDPIAPVSNSINHRLVIGFNDNFINPIANSFYSVIAIIDGKKYY